MKNIVDLNKFAEGALLQKVNKEMQKIVDNIYDPNTLATKTRTLTIKLTFTADEERELIETGIDVSASLAGHRPAKTKMLMGKENGQVTAKELLSGKKGQMFMDVDEGKVKTDVGESVEEVESKKSVVQFKGAAK